MHIAVCYSGFPRHIIETFQSTQSQLFHEGDTIDYFVHTWNVPEYSREIDFIKTVIRPRLIYIEDVKQFERHPYCFISADTSADIYKQEVHETYAHEGKRFFDPPSEENGYKFDKALEVVKFPCYSSFPYNVLCQYYSIFKSNELKNLWKQQQDIKYDCIVRLRSDLIFHQPIPIRDYMMDKLYVLWAATHKGTDLTIHDHFAFGPDKLMDIYAQCFLFMPAIYFIYKTDFVQELLLGQHLRINNIPVYKIHCPTQILRHDNKEHAMLNPRI